MISRWKSPTLTRNIAYSMCASFPDYPLRVAAQDALSRVCEDKETAKVPSDVAPKSSYDPWAPIFDEISTDTPPVYSPRSNLPTRFFTSRPAPNSFFSSNIPHSSPGSGSGTARREYGTHASERDSHYAASADKKEDFTAWDHIFEGVDGGPTVGSFGPRGIHTSNTFSSARRPKRNRPTMTAREISAFDKMFDMIFTAVSDKRRESFTTAAAQVQSTSRQPQSGYGDLESSLSWDTETFGSSGSTDPDFEASASQQVGLPPPDEAFDRFGRLRRRSNLMRQTSATAERLDRQKEEVELCDSDQQLLEWTVREVFQGDHIPESGPSPPPPPPPSSSSSTSASPPSPHISEEIARYIANPTYPHLLAHVMRTFRIKYNDPHTALALFAHAKRRSTHSYIFGCTTPAYNELLETRWELDGVLEGIEEALIEMRANGVRPDKCTRKLVERVRREVGERFLSRKGGDLNGNVWEALERVEALVASRKKSERGGGKGGEGRDNGRDSKLEAKKRHWNEEWKTENAEAFILGEDRLTLA